MIKPVPAAWETWPVKKEPVVLVLVMMETTLFETELAISEIEPSAKVAALLLAELLLWKIEVVGRL